MYSRSVRIRTFNAGCAHEIILENGKVIIIDPFFTGPHMDGHSIDEITGADYILITHTHFDHDLNLGELVRKFNAKVFVGTQSAVPLLKFHKISYDNVYPVYPGQELIFEDFTLDVLQAKHNPTGSRLYSEETDIARDALGIVGHKECDDCGNLESLDYMITTNNSFKILTASGQLISNTHFAWCKEQGPNVLLRQAGVRTGGADLFSDGQVSPHELAQLFVKYHAQLIIPFHMDVIYKKWGKGKTDQYFQEVEKEVQILSPGSLFVLPEPWKWYEIGVSMIRID